MASAIGKKNMALERPELVGLLYAAILGRTPDADGLRHWFAALEQGASLEDVARDIHASPEAAAMRDRPSPEARRRRIDDAVVRLLGDRLTKGFVVLDIGAQTLEHETHVYGPLLARDLVDRVIGFEPLSDKADARSAEPKTQIHHFALGTGKDETLHVNNFDATSSVYPINEALMDVTDGLDNLRTVRRERIRTVRLDDVDLPERIDLLKVDVQGFEFPILENGTATLGRTLVLQTEVEFQPIYLGQPLFDAVFRFLVDRGFVLHDVANQTRLASSGARAAGVAQPASRLFWGDAVFLREPVQDPSALLRQATIAHLVYGWHDLTYELLLRRDAATGQDLAREYLDVLSAPA
jgi:FkbM family methyltransferase